MPSSHPFGSEVNHVVGTTEVLLSRPVGADTLVLQVESGTFRYRIGDYVGRAFAAAAVTVATDVVAVTAHGLDDGDGPYKLTTDDTLPEPFASDPDLLAWVRVVDANSFQLFESEAEALDLESSVGLVNFTDQGVGNHALGSPAGWAPAATPTAAVSDGYGSSVLAAGASLIGGAPEELTVVGFSATDVLTYWWRD